MKDKVDLLIFSGQSNMQGQTEGPCENNEVINNCFEYKYLSDSLTPLKHPVGETIGTGELICGPKSDFGYFCSQISWLSALPHLPRRRCEECVAVDKAIMTAQEKVAKTDGDFIMLTDICKQLSRNKEYINPYAEGHYNNKVLATIGKIAGEALAEFVLGGIDTDKLKHFTELKVVSTVDATLQPSLFYQAKEKNRPLLVGLHTWSADRFNQIDNLLPVAIENDWNLLLPEFRGPNLASNPTATDACGSLKAKQDVIDAVNFVNENFDIDPQNIFLMGASGGGHMALLLAAYATKLWRAVCSFVPITDLKKWHKQNPYYADAIEACCENEDEYDYRSPISYIDQIAQANIKIYSGKWDASVPCSHGLELYNSIFQKHPQARVYFEMFDGGHEMLIEKGVRWLKQYIKGCKVQNIKVTK